MGRHTNSAYGNLLEMIEAKGRGSIIFNRDFPDFSSEEIRWTFSRMVDDNVLIRLANGIYLYPKTNRFGVEYPSTDELAKAIAKRDSAHIIPSGMTAANMLGLSEQVTMKSVYLTDGAARKIEIRGRIIEFKRTVPGNFAYRTTLMPMLIQALKAISKDNITAEHKKQLLKLLSLETDQDGLKEDIAKAPQWIKKLLKGLLNFQRWH